MGVSRVDYAGETLVDLTGDTVNEQSLLSGYTAHGADGEPVEGNAIIPTKVSQLENDAGYAKTESPAFTGIPTAPTPHDNTNSTQIATTAYVKKLIANLVNGAPETLDTLKEIADALGENDDAVQALNAAIGNKVDKVAGKGLSTNDFTTAEKNKLSGIATGANKTTYTNNLSATVAGTALDAVQGKVLNDKGAQMSVYVGTDGNLHFRNWAGADTVIPFSAKKDFKLTIHPNIQLVTSNSLRGSIPVDIVITVINGDISISLSGNNRLVYGSNSTTLAGVSVISFEYL